MTIAMGVCASCNGRGREDYPNPGEHKCYSCNGFKVQPKRGGSYKTAKGAADGITKRTAWTCFSCRGAGTQVTPPDHECYACRGSGTDVVSAAPGDLLPEDFDRYRHQSSTAAQEYARTVPIVIRRHGDKVLSWGASYLGLGTVWTSTDYGDAFKADDATVTAKVREELARGTQWCKFAGEDRRIADTVLVSVTRNGYTVTTAASAEGRPILPPTYTPEVLNRPTA